MATHIRNYDSGYSLERCNCYTLATSCSFCGSSRTTGHGRKYLYKYSTVSPMGRIEYVKGLFCSIQCLRAYHYHSAY